MRAAGSFKTLSKPRAMDGGFSESPAIDLTCAKGKAEAQEEGGCDAASPHCDLDRAALSRRELSNVMFSWISRVLACVVWAVPKRFQQGLRNQWRSSRGTQTMIRIGHRTQSHPKHHIYRPVCADLAKASYAV